MRAGSAGYLARYRDHRVMLSCPGPCPGPSVTVGPGPQPQGDFKFNLKFSESHLDYSESESLTAVRTRYKPVRNTLYYATVLLLLLYRLVPLRLSESQAH